MRKRHPYDELPPIILLASMALLAFVILAPQNCAAQASAADPLITAGNNSLVQVLSFRADPPIIQSAVSLGADGYLLKNARPDEILAAIREVMRGGCYFSPPVAREIVDQVREPRGKGEEPFTQLSLREREVLRHIAEGLSAKEIASELKISTKTVEAHRTSVMRKLGVRKATELVRYAVRHGLIEA